MALFTFFWFVPFLIFYLVNPSFIYNRFLYFIYRMISLSYIFFVITILIIFYESIQQSIYLLSSPLIIFILKDYLCTFDLTSNLHVIHSLTFFYCICQLNSLYLFIILFTFLFLFPISITHNPSSYIDSHPNYCQLPSAYFTNVISVINSLIIFLTPLQFLFFLMRFHSSISIKPFSSPQIYAKSE